MILFQKNADNGVNEKKNNGHVYSQYSNNLINSLIIFLFITVYDRIFDNNYLLNLDDCGTLADVNKPTLWVFFENLYLSERQI